MTSASALARGRDSFAKKAWGTAYAQLKAADLDEPLEVDDLERLATAAYLIGKDTENDELRARAYHLLIERGDVERAVKCAFWTGFHMVQRGDMALAGGWFARAGKLLEDAPTDGVEQGYAFLPLALQSMFGGAPAEALPMFVRVAGIAQRFNDSTLLTLANLGQGQSHVSLGEFKPGVALMDEVMVAVTAGEVGPAVVGLAYCAAIDACREIFDLRRVHEWTAALTRWCESQPDLVPYRGQCLVHRSEVFQLLGAWAEAAREAADAQEWLVGHPAAGAAFYQVAELQRLRGEFEAAEESYRQANHLGHDPQPGLARLRLAQGHFDRAEKSIRASLQSAHDVATRARLLPAFVEIAIACGDTDAARTAVDELAELASQFESPLLSAISTTVRGAALQAEGDAKSARDTLRAALKSWHQLEAPYEAARTRVLIAAASQSLGDRDTADLELDAARRTFLELGAAADLATLPGTESTPAGGGSGLSTRELEVLRLLATGKTNRTIAAELVISEKTVARHVSNIFMKLDVSSRAAATAFAHKHGLA